MPLRNFQPDRRRALLALSAVVILLGLPGCWKKSGVAVVREKIHVPARPVSVSPNESPSPAASEPPEALAEGNSTESVTETVDEAPQPSVDPRALDHEQWIVRVEMAADLKKIEVPVEPAQWEKLKPGDRVHVSYREGKYTGTVWSAELKE